MFDGKWRTAVDRRTKPVGQALVKSRVTPNQLTLFGVVMSVGGAVAIGSGHLVWGVVSLFACGLPDLFDGPLAKATGRASVQGAFLDSVADRVSDGFLFGGVAWYLASRHGPHAAILAMAVLGATMLVSYVRAKAEALGLSAKGGLMERAERFIALGLALVFSPAMVVLLWVMLGLTLVTAIGRFWTVWQQAPGPALPSERHRTSTIVAWRERHAEGGPSRWRQRQHEEMSTRVGRFASKAREGRVPRHQVAGSRWASSGPKGEGGARRERPRLDGIRSRRASGRRPGRSSAA